eukprot:6200277-Pleurochrysis_carterae.AAC.4
MAVAIGSVAAGQLGCQVTARVHAAKPDKRHAHSVSCKYAKQGRMGEGIQEHLMLRNTLWKGAVSQSELASSGGSTRGVQIAVLTGRDQDCSGKREGEKGRERKRERTLGCHVGVGPRVQSRRPQTGEKMKLTLKTT